MTTTAPSGARRNMFDPEVVRADFPALQQEVHGKPLVYLDNGATSQKPQCVIDAITHYYAHDNSNVHRGVHTLSERATVAYEATRDSVRDFINAEDRREIIFCRGTTEALNLLAYSWGRPTLRSGDEVLITAMEHHSNIVPWQIVCEQTGATLKAVPMDDRGQLDMDAFDRLLNERTRIVSVVHVANSLGTVNPVAEIVAKAHAAGALAAIDGAQAAPHMPVDVRRLDCDFYAFSGHKTFGPTGIGVLYGKRSLLESMAPFQGGGDMIRSVSLEGSTWNDLPYKFEAGTPNIAGTIGLGKAIAYLSELDMDAVRAHEDDLLRYGADALREVPGLREIGTAEAKAGVLSFVLEDIHPHDIGTIVDHEGVAIRTGHHCAMPVMAHFDVPATSRASIALYNTRSDIDALVKALHKVRRMFG